MNCVHVLCGDRYCGPVNCILPPWVHAAALFILVNIICIILWSLRGPFCCVLGSVLRPYGLSLYYYCGPMGLAYIIFAGMELLLRPPPNPYTFIGGRYCGPCDIDPNRCPPHSPVVGCGRDPSFL